MASSREEVKEALGKMPVVEIVQLIADLEKEWGVSAAAPVAMAAAGGASDAAAGTKEEQTEFTVTLTGFGEKKINVIKVVRTLTGLGLKEAKDMVEAVPSAVKSDVSKADAAEAKKQLEEAGATVEVK